MECCGRGGKDVPGYGGVSVIGVRLVEFVLLLRGVRALPAFRCRSILRLLLDVDLLVCLTIFHFDLWPVGVVQVLLCMFGGGSGVRLYSSFVV